MHTMWHAIVQTLVSLLLLVASLVGLIWHPDSETFRSAGTYIFMALLLTSFLARGLWIAWWKERKGRRKEPRPRTFEELWKMHTQ